METRANTIKFKIKSKIDELTIKEIIDIYTTLCAIRICEKRLGNEYIKAHIKIKYTKETEITEYLNIFNIARTPLLYELAIYLKTIKKKYNEQMIETKLEINDYFTDTENTSQEIQIITQFNIQSTHEEILKKKKILLRSIELSDIEDIEKLF